MGYILLLFFYGKFNSFIASINTYYWIIIVFLLKSSLGILTIGVSFGQMIMKLKVQNKKNGNNITKFKLLFRNMLLILFLSRFIDDIFVILYLPLFLFPLILKPVGSQTIIDLIFKTEVGKVKIINNKTSY
jgi:hypothetical protein